MKLQINVNDKESVRSSIEHLRELEPNSIWLHVLQARSFLFDEKFHKAKNEFQLVLEHSQFDHKILMMLATMLSQIKNMTGLKVILFGIRSEFANFLFNSDNIGVLEPFIEKLNYQKLADRQYIKSLTKHLISFFANTAYEQNKIDLAFYLEQKIYSIFITGFETDEAFGYGMKLTKDSAVAAGKRHNKFLKQDITDDKNEKPVVGFFFHNASMLAHIENVYTFLVEASMRKFEHFTPIIFCLGGRDASFENNFRNINVKIHYLDVSSEGRPINSTLKRIEYLKFLCNKFKVNKIVWGCLASLMPFAFSLRIAEEQIWWSQKWQSLELDSIDKYIWSFDVKETQLFNGHSWRCGWFQKEAWLNSVNENELQLQKKKYHGKLVLGSLARTDKLRHTPYLLAICEILKHNDNVIYLWAGREEDPFISNAFKDAGVRDKTEFIGWVNTSLFANVLDLMLDTFPIGNGITAFQAMEAGTPVIMRKSTGEIRTLDLLLNPRLDEGDTNSFEVNAIRKSFSQKGQDCSYYLLCDSSEEYIECANRLIADESFRVNAGFAYKACVNNLLQSPKFAYERFSAHLLS